jgi:thiamine-phosphate pyrophosphorylase
MITDPKYSLEETFEAIKKHKPDFVCYRNKIYFDKEEIIKFAKFAKNYSKVFINLDDLREKNLLEFFEGVHIPSSKLEKIEEFKNKTVIASTHNIQEVLKAKNADFITFSPIFNSKGRKGLGVDALKEISKLHKNVFALGGITGEKEVKKIEKSPAIGFASIRYFYK